MYQCGWLKGVIEPLGTHTSDGDTPEFRIENFDQSSSSFRVSMAKAHHQFRYGVRLEGRQGHLLEAILSRAKNNCRLAIQFAGILSLYVVSSD